jgi:nucleotide-sensitive chloride channel 1A
MLTRSFAGQIWSAPVEPIFSSLSLCASLHPSIFDDVDGMSDDEGIYDDPSSLGGFIPFTGEDGEELSEAGRVRSNFVNPQSRYAPY